MFVAERDRVAPKGSEVRAAIDAILLAFADDRQPLPGIADHSVDLPPYVMGRTVPSSSLVVAYMPMGEVVYVIALVSVR